MTSTCTTLAQLSVAWYVPQVISKGLALEMTLHPKTIILRSQSYIVHLPEDVWSKDNGERDWGHLVLTCEGGRRESEREREREGGR